MIARYNEYNHYLEMTEKFLDNLDIPNVNESNVNEILKKTFQDLKLNFKLVTTFGFGVGAFLPIVKSLIENMSFSVDINKETYILLTLTSLSIIFLEENREIEGSDDLKKDCKSLLEELRMRGIGNGIVKKLVAILQSIKKIFNSIGKHLGVVATGLLDMLNYTFLLVPIVNGLSYIIKDYNIGIDDAKGNLMGILLGIGGMAAKHGISFILKKIKGLDRSTFLKISHEFDKPKDIDDIDIDDMDSSDMIKDNTNKHRVFESSESIEDICRKYNIQNWTLNSDGSIDVDGDVILTKMIRFGRESEAAYNDYLKGVGLTELPLKFGRVSGNFDCSYNQLTSLKGCPKEVGGYFNCTNNKLTTLKYCPNKVSGGFSCVNNQLTSLEGSPRILSTFDCSGNKLSNLEGGPVEISGSEFYSDSNSKIRYSGNFRCDYNKLTSLVGGPNFVEGDFRCIKNNLSNLEGCPEKIYGDFICYDNDIFSLDFYPTVLTGNLITGEYKRKTPIHEIWNNVIYYKPGNHGNYLHLFDFYGPVRFENGKWVCYREPLDDFFKEIKCPSPAVINGKNYNVINTRPLKGPQYPRRFYTGRQYKSFRHELFNGKPSTNKLRKFRK